MVVREDGDDNLDNSNEDSNNVDDDLSDEDDVKNLLRDMSENTNKSTTWQPETSTAMF